MSLIQQIKSKNLDARRQKLTAVSSLLTTLVGEAEMIGKNAGREVTDQEVQDLVRKFIKNNNETIAVLGDANARTLEFIGENETLKTFLPQQMTSVEITEAVQSCITSLRAAQSKVDMGAVMKMMKQHFDGTYDGKAASVIIKQALA